MPIFEYICEKTDCESSNKTVEVLCKSDDRPECDICGTELKKLMSAAPGYVIGTGTYTRCK